MTDTKSKIRGVTPTTEDGYTSEPTHLRIYKDDWIDSSGRPWALDAADEDGNYTEGIESFATFEDAVAAIPVFIMEVTANWQPKWRWMATLHGRLTADGTTASETVVCTEHTAHSPVVTDASGPLVDVSGNDVVACIVCGKRGERS